ncbi:MAG: hypothetical protein WCK82_14620, partial [Bacteroidota bacterium]
MSGEGTSILDLPTDPVGGGGGNISIRAQEVATSSANANANVNTNANANANGVTLDQSTISQIVTGLQQATMAGATQLPSRDIPMNTNNLTADPQTMPNYVPPPPPQKIDYISHMEQTSDILQQQQQRQRNNSALDDMYNEIQTPVLLAVLFFL